MEAVTADETRKVLIGEDPKQDARPKKRLETASCISYSVFMVDSLPSTKIQ